MFPPQAILRGTDTLPVAPAVVTRVTALMSDPSVTAAGLEEAIKLDPVLTANLIQAANSVFRGAGQRISTLREAVDRVGVHRLLEVAVGSSLRRRLPSRIPGYGISAEKFWIHCVAVATVAEALAKETRLPSADMAFTAGLLHDIGQIVIGDFFAETMPESDWWTFGTPAEERSFLGCNHCDVGKGLAERWHLPAKVADTCRWHHELPKAPEGIDVGLNTAIHVADAMAFKLGFGGVGYHGEVLDPLAVSQLGRSEAELFELASSVRANIGQNAVASGMDPSHSPAGDAFSGGPGHAAGGDCRAR